MAYSTSKGVIARRASRGSELQFAVLQLDCFARIRFSFKEKFHVPMLQDGAEF